MTDLDAIRANAEIANRIFLPHLSYADQRAIDRARLHAAHDVPALLDMVDRLTAEVERLRDDVANLHMAHGVLLANHSLTVAERDAARAEVERLRSSFGPVAADHLIREAETARADLDRRDAALDAVRALHSRFGGEGQSGFCDAYCFSDPTPWPCPTIAAIDGALTAGETP